MTILIAGCAALADSRKLSMAKKAVGISLLIAAPCCLGRTWLSACNANRCLSYLPAVLPACLPAHLHTYVPTYLPTYLPRSWRSGDLDDT